MTDRILDLLKNGEDEAMFSKTLATIRRDAPIKFSVPERSWQESVSVDKTASFFREMEFKSLQGRFLSVLGKDIPEASPVSEEQEEASYENIPEEKIQKAKIAFWLLNSEQSDPNIDDVAHYKNSNSFDEAYQKLEHDIEEQKLSYVYHNIEIPIIPIIESMEKRGISVDVNYLKKISKEYHTELEKIEQEIWKLSGREFNINSPKQLGEVLFDDLGLTAKGMKKSAGGARSTRESELEKLRDLHPVIGEIFKYRELQKLLSTYIDTIPDQVSDDGRLHAHFIQAGTTTGRFSSSNPNLQNIPIKTERGKNIRHAFVASEGYVLASFDYSQIELRVAALMSQDSYFIKAFQEGKDIHAAVAMKVFGVPEPDVTHDMRRRAKVINFGILYGMGVTALRENLGGERKEAQAFHDNYFAQFPTIAGYLESIKNFAKAYGYTETLFGRRRYFPGIKSPIPFIRAAAERTAVNAPIQGTATADIVKIGMKKAQDALVLAGLEEDVHLLLQVHDELVYEIKKDSLEKAKEAITRAMITAIPKEFLENLDPVPLEVSYSYGRTWGDLK